MDEQLTLAEIFDIADQVGRNARDFYEEATTLFAHHSNLFLDMVTLEDDFARALDRLKQVYLKGKKSSVVADDSLRKSVSGLHVLASADPARIFHDRIRKDEIIQISMKIEKDVLKYFSGLKSFTADDDVKKILQLILEAKARQIRTLASWL
ncbi:MAG: hypothetical protein IH624_15015 [Phycisphaerae bacterium]|nr:hypothetical protein [Phycisphaerae bacterium]